MNKAYKNTLEKIKMQPKIFIIGYGSIINTPSRLLTGNTNIGNAIPVHLGEALAKSVCNLLDCLIRLAL